jgi:glutamyl-tRNA synthetase
MKISHVIRAEEWLSSTPKHVLLYQAFGWKPPKFVHLPLLRNPDKSKISKRKNPVSLIWYREQGYLPEALLNYLATMGWSMPGDKEIFDLGKFIDNFNFDRIDPAGPIFDIQKLDWMNGEYIRKSDNKKLVKLLEDFAKVGKEDVERVLPLVKERMKKLSEFDSLTDFIFKEEVSPDKNQLTVRKYGGEKTAEALLEVTKAIESESKWNDKSIESAVESKRSRIGWTKSELYMPIRVAVSASTTTPPLFETMEAIGKDRVVKRLDSAVKKLSK